jgi:hypothetical protein
MAWKILQQTTLVDAMLIEHGENAFADEKIVI